MARLHVTLACGDYDRTRALEEGTIQPDGIELTYVRLPVEETFFRMLRHQEFDIAEMSLSSYAISLRREPAPFVALPVFTSRSFRHGSIFVSTEAGIATPRDLRGPAVGPAVGVPEFQLTATVWVRGVLADFHDVPVDCVTYRTGGQERPGRAEKAPLALPQNIRASRFQSARPCRRCCSSGRSTSCIRRGFWIPLSVATCGSADCSQM